MQKNSKIDKCTQVRWNTMKPSDLWRNKFCVQNIIKTASVFCIGHVARMGKVRTVWTILVENPEGST